MLSYFRVCYNSSFIFDIFFTMCRFFFIFLWFPFQCFAFFFTLQSGVSSRQAHDRLAFSGGPSWHM